MNRIETILEKMQSIIVENLEIDETIHLKDDLTKYFKDSIQFIKVIVGIETLFNIEFTDEEISIDYFVTVEDIVMNIDKKWDGKFNGECM